MNSAPKPYQIVIMAAGALMLIFSFLNWVGEGDFAENAWGSGLFPLATFAVLCGVAMAVVAAIQAFSPDTLPASVLGFTWGQIHLALSVYALLITFHFLLVEKGGADLGIGLILSLLGALGLVAGAVMMKLDEGTGAVGRGPAPPPQSF